MTAPRRRPNRQSQSPEAAQPAAQPGTPEPVGLPRISPRPLRDPRSLDDLLIYRLSRIVSAASVRVIRLCEGRYGISRREWRLISLLATGGGILSSELAERVHLDRARTSRAVTSLVSKGLVERQGRAGDRRQAELCLSATGQALYAELFPQVQAINRELLAPFDLACVEQLDQVLSALQAHADALNAQVDTWPKTHRWRGGRERSTLA